MIIKIYKNGFLSVGLSFAFLNGWTGGDEI